MSVGATQRDTLLAVFISLSIKTLCYCSPSYGHQDQVAVNIRASIRPCIRETSGKRKAVTDGAAQAKLNG